MMPIRPKRTAVVVPHLRSALRVRACKKVVITAVSFLGNTGAVLAKHNLELARIGLMEQDAFLGFRFEVDFIEAHVGAVTPDGRAIPAEQAYLQRAGGPLLNA